MLILYNVVCPIILYFIEYVTITHYVIKFSLCYVGEFNSGPSREIKQDSMKFQLSTQIQ